MAEILKPAELNDVWASGGDVISPGTSKIASGWAVEIPPRQWFNYIDNKQDQAIAHINQHGIAVWDSVTEYQAGKSFVQGSNGNIYKSLTTNTNVNPVSDGGTNWQIAFGSFADFANNKADNGYQKLPNGLIIQWGSGTTVTGNGDSVSYPIAFPTAARQVVVTEGSPAGWLSPPSPTIYGGRISGTTTFLVSGVRILTGTNVPAYQAGISYRWIAIGH